MRILNRDEFLALDPEKEWVYAEFEPQVCEHIKIKCKGNNLKNDWYYQNLSPEALVDARSDCEVSDILFEMERNHEIDSPCDYNVIGRDGAFKQDHLFIVLSRDDVSNLIARLARSLK